MQEYIRIAIAADLIGSRLATARVADLSGAACRPRRDCILLCPLRGKGPPRPRSPIWPGSTPRLFLNPSHQDLSLGSTISYRKAVQSSSGEKRTATDAPVPER